MFLSLRELLLSGNWGGVGRRGRRRVLDSRRQLQRQRLFERLEPRVVLNAAPIAKDDPWYSTAQDTALTVGSSDTTLLENDWDPEGSALTTAVVANPGSGSLTTFNTDGTFTYTPNTGFSGLDSFTYKANDGSVDSHVVTVSIAVGGDLGVRTNLEEASRGGSHARQTSVFDARYQGIAKIEYPLHPLFGREGRVVRSVRYGSLTCLEIEIDQKIVNVARWMTRADLCSGFICGPDPQPDLDALVQILTLLDQHHDGTQTRA